MTITLYNTLSRKKDVFEPLDPASVRMYVCGPTVYDYAHIGNARPVIVFDVLFRLLRQVYGAAHVTYVRNITDVDDKIIARAAEAGVDIRTLTETTNAQFQADVTALGCLPPTVQPRATEHIEEMVALIQVLIERGHAYKAEGHVLFDVPSMAEYGHLSNRSVEEMQAGARVEVAPYKKDPMDFVLWKPAPEGEQGFESALGRGRPGWHIECSAMAKAHLGEVFDIHGGGIDLVFPHHENEIAQSRCAHGSHEMARYWMHNGYLQVEGEKMSKSLGNFITVNEVLKDWPGETARLAMLMTHYRQPINWTVKSLSEAQKTLTSWYEAIGEEALPSEDAQPHDAVFAALRDDLNTPKAIAELHQLKSQPAHLKAAAGLLGLLTKSGADWAELTRVEAGVSDAEIEAAIAARLQAREDKDWAEADRIRDELLEKGIVLKDGPEGTSWDVQG
ncbi:MAG: cysteine--tRNA ligase [Rhodomicrobium sp.]|nr:MAG: cysteine--tRNA ligase [Rhodomicrobium sp.]